MLEGYKLLIISNSIFFYTYPNFFRFKICYDSLYSPINLASSGKCTIKFRCDKKSSCLVNCIFIYFLDVITKISRKQPKPFLQHQSIYREDNLTALINPAIDIKN